MCDQVLRCKKKTRVIKKPSTITGTICKMRWRNIRECYRKSIQKLSTKSGQSSKQLKCYKYAEQLGFLKSTLECRETVGSVSQDEKHYDIAEEESIQMPVQQEVTVPEAGPSQPTGNARKRKRHEINDNITLVMEYVQKREEKRTPVDAFLVLMKSMMDELDEDEFRTTRTYIFRYLQSMLAEKYKKCLRTSSASLTRQVLENIRDDLFRC
ncbi:uncharacterized protein LOC113464112 [Ceratina calcarata]|uniref:Uncharacterized protein LOC113464112 n=1 Tax=Ceratina calcarata TaxID=156304 RepID=A0AAJ7W993_9HYME|nr:uncharacterized protein LOC113464112 [Ceratina calcarata]